jgi:hypothetical protein
MHGIYWLASYPKSGNTWLRVFLENLRKKTNVPADINELKNGHIASSRVWLDDVLGFDCAELSHTEIERLRPQIYDWSSHTEGIGYHKIHDAYQITEDGLPIIGKESTLGAIYIVRNPLDIAASLANHNSTSIDQAIEQMGSESYSLNHSLKRIGNQVKQRLNTWSKHVASWVDAPNLNCLTIRYEDMLAHPIVTFTQVSTFLNLSRNPVEILQAIEFSSFQELAKQEREKEFKEAPAKMGRFFRNGIADGWRSELTNSQVERIISDHGPMMQRFGYLSNQKKPM